LGSPKAFNSTRRGSQRIGMIGKELCVPAEGRALEWEDREKTSEVLTSCSVKLPVPGALNPPKNYWWPIKCH